MKILHLKPRFFPALISFMVICIAPGLFAAENEVIRLSEPFEVTATHEVFGGTLPESGSFNRNRGPSELGVTSTARRLSIHQIKFAGR